ncbi:MAG TPA: hypothetical protein VF988_10320, partial [Verrucomicrobiae bacterium]
MPIWETAKRALKFTRPSKANAKKTFNPKTEVEEADAISYGEPAVVGRVTPCAPSWYNRMRLLAGGGAQRSARPTALDWRLTVSISTS